MPSSSASQLASSRCTPSCAPSRRGRLRSSPPAPLRYSATPPRPIARSSASRSAGVGARASATSTTMSSTRAGRIASFQSRQRR
jgi:hypothetical protein